MARKASAKPKGKMGRPLVAAKPMKQIAIRLTDEIIAGVDAIVAERFGQADRTAVIRELLSQALDARRRK